MPWGAMHGAWKGDAASIRCKHQRAQRRFPLGPCERCDRPGRDRHHIDGNPGNNAPENIAILCRRCHEEVDGRLEAAITRLKLLHIPEPLRTCANCGRHYKPLRRERCSPCYLFWRKHGRDITEKEQRSRASIGERDRLIKLALAGVPVRASL